MTRVVLLHGNGNSHGSDNFFPSIQEELDKLGIENIAPDLPDNVLARMKFWFPYFKDVLKLGKDDILTGHSTGAVAAMKFAETNKIGASILIGTYYTDLGYEDERTSGYFDDPDWNWQAIRANQKWTAIYASTDDPYIPIEQPRYICDQLGSEYFEFTNQGHFGDGDHPKSDFPELLDFLKLKLGKQ